MAKPILVRKSFNAGELSPELHYRDDLAAYVKGCKHLSNMTPTPYGAVTRRPPFELLAKIDTALFGVPVRYIPFKFSLTEVFHIVFTDGSGSESTDPTTADLIVFDAGGSQVVFDGTPDVPLSVLPLTLSSDLEGASTLSSGFIAMASTIYDPADLGEIHFINVNDYVYLTCGGNYPAQRINRFFDKAEEANRWKIEDAPITGGPFDTPRSSSMAGDQLNFFVDLWEAAKSYEVGDVVSIGFSTPVQSFDVTSTSSNFLGKMPSGNYGFTVNINIGVSPDTSLTGYLRNVWLHPTSNARPTYFDPECSGAEAVSISGYHKYETSTASGGVITVRLYRKENVLPKFISNYAGASGAFYFNYDAGISGSPFRNLQFYRAITDNTNSSPLTNPLDWLLVPALSPEDVISMDKTSKPELEFGINQLVSANEGSDFNQFAWTHNPTYPSSAVVETPPFSFVDTVTMETSGSWGGTLVLEETIDYGVTYQKIGEITSAVGSYNGSLERNPTSSNSFCRMRVVNYQAQDPSKFQQPFLLMKLTGNRLYAQTAKILERDPLENGKYSVSASNHLNSNISFVYPRYAIGEWGGESGYPFSLTIHDERICYAGSKVKPNTVFASRVNDWENFIQGTEVTSPYTFTIASDSFDTIRSLRSSRQLNIFTDNQEVTMGSRDDNEVTSAVNVSVSSHTNYGSSGVQSIQMADMVWFVMGQGERVRASRYDFSSDGQQSSEMSLFASHITKSGVKEMSFRRHPYNSLFCLLHNGTSAVLTYEGEQEVKAWATISTDGGEILSAAANYSDTGDIVAGVVKRGDSYFLESFGDIDESTVFLDNQTTWLDEDFTIGKQIDQDDDGSLVVVHDDVELVAGVDYTIAGGLLTIPSVTTGAVAIGRKYVSRVNPTDISEVAPSGVVKRLTELGMYLLDSGTCTIRINGKESPFTDGLKWGAGQRESGLFDLTTGGDYEQGLDIDITIDSHRHFTLTGLGYRLSISNG